MQTWIDSHPDEAGDYQASISLDDVAGWHLDNEDPTLRWRGEVLDQATQQRSVMASAPDLDAWCADLDEIIKGEGIRLAPQKRQRTRSPGQSRSGRHMWCDDETLGDVDGLIAILYFKTASTRHPGRVSIDVSMRADDARGDELADLADKAGFASRRTKATVIIESCPDEAVAFNMAQSVETQRSAVESLARAAKDLQTWWATVELSGR